MGQAAGKPFGAGAAAVLNRPLQCTTGWEREERQEIGVSRLGVLACFLHHDRSGCLRHTMLIPSYVPTNVHSHVCGRMLLGRRAQLPARPGGHFHTVRSGF